MIAAVPSVRSYSLSKRPAWWLLALGCVLPWLTGNPRAQAAGENSPNGVAVPFNVADLVTSAGSYSALTGSVIRTVPDLVVPGAVGQYPLAFVRTSTSRYVPGGEDDGSGTISNGGPFGPAGSWRHNYRWNLFRLQGTGDTTVWQVNYPEGRVVRFTKVTDLKDPATGNPLATQDPYRRSQTPGVSDRLEAVTGNGDFILHRHDGGTVYFQKQGTGLDALYKATQIIDPFGQVTNLSYYTANDLPNGSASGKLWRVTEPAGRYLNLRYKSFNGGVVIDTVTASNGQVVTYGYGTFPTGATTLSSVTYNGDIDPVTNQSCFASYTYAADNTGANQRPLLSACDDPRFPGPLVKIKYQYAGSGATYGQIQAEIDMSTGPSGTTISTFDQASRTNTRGDGPNQKFNYPSAASYLPQSISDFETKNTSFGYDPNLYTNTVVDRNNHGASIFHEPYVGRKLSVSTTDGGSGTLTATYNYGGSQGNPYPLNPYYLMQVTTPQGLTTTYTRDASHQITRIDYASGAYELLYYTGFGQVFSHRMANGNNITNYFDVRGLLYQSTDAFNNTDRFTRYYYDAYDRLNQVTDFQNRNTFFFYNTRHQLTQIKHRDGNNTRDLSVTYTYDKYGNQLTVTDELGHVTTTTYDGKRRPRSVKVPVDQASNNFRTTTFTYERGSASADTHTARAVGTVTLPTGKNVVRTYSENGRLRDVTMAPGTSDAAKTAYTYYPGGQVKTVTDPNNRTTTYVYDGVDRLSTIQDALQHVTSYYYYGAGSGPNTGKLGVIVYPDNTQRHFYNYEYSGQAQTIQDPNSCAAQANGQSPWYESHYFDTVGRPTLICSGRNGINTTFSYNDPRGYLTSTNFPDGTQETQSYDSMGNVAQTTNRAGTTCTLTYNYLDQLNGRSWNDGGITPTEAYTYDDAGRHYGYFNGYTATYTNFYDNGQLMWEAHQPDGNSGAAYTQYHLDPNGCVDQIAYPGGDSELPTYTGRNQLDTQRFYTTSSGNTSQVADYNYNADGQLAARYLPNNTYTAFGYDAGGRINLSVNYRYSPSYRDISQRTNGRDAMGRMTWFKKLADNTSGSSTESGRGDGFNYDSNGQIIFANMDAVNVDGAVDSHGDSQQASTGLGFRASSYAYDVAGNRTQANNSGSVDTYTAANNNDTYPGINNSVTGNVPIAYNDGRANVTGFAGWNYSYDAKGQLLSAASGGTTVQFIYDNLGRRTRRYVNGALQRIYHYDGWNVIEERNASNQKVYSYVYGAGGELLERVAANGTPLYYHYDARGFVIAVTDVAANVVEQYAYDVYGAPIILDAAGNQRPGNVTAVDNHFFWVNSYEWQPEMNLYLCGHRFYSPKMGRWLSPDPIGYGGGDVNWSRYCENDPINMADPSGLVRSPGSDKKYTDTGAGGESSHILGLGDTPTGSQIPSSRFWVSNAQGILIRQGSGVNGFNTVWQSSPSVTTVGGLSAVGPQSGNGYTNGNLAILGTGQDYKDAAATAADTKAIVLYSSHQSWFYDIAMDIYSKIFGSYNNQDPIDLKAYASGFSSPPNIIGYSKGTFAMVEAAHNYGLQASSMSFVAPAISIWGAKNAAREAGAVFEGYDQRWFDVSNTYAPSANPLKWISGFVPIVNVMVHTGNYPPFAPIPPEG